MIEKLKNVHIFLNRQKTDWDEIDIILFDYRKKINEIIFYIFIKFGHCVQQNELRLSQEYS